MSSKVTIEVVSGVEGPSVYINDYRVAGPKPWGGGRVTHRFACDVANIEKALADSKEPSDVERGAE